MQKYSHTKKFAKHIVALVVKQIEGLTDAELADIFGTGIEKTIGYRKKPNKSIFSEVRERADPVILEELDITKPVESQSKTSPCTG